MMSLERFLRECEALIRGKEPFLGYWHAHGFGLFRIDRIAKKYNGYVNRQYEEGIFATELMIPMTSN